MTSRTRTRMGRRCGIRRLFPWAAALLASLAMTACARGGPSTSVSWERKVLLKVTLEGGAVSGMEIVGVFQAAELHSLGGLHGEGEMIVSLEDTSGHELFAGSALDPRRMSWDLFGDASIRGGGSLVLDRVTGFVAVPEPASGRGLVKLSLSSPLGPVVPAAFTFDTATGQTQSAVFHLEEGELAFLAGNPVPTRSFIVLFVANGFGDDLETFDAMARGVAGGLLGQGWYDEHQEIVSLWTMVDSEANDDASIVCGGNTMPELLEAGARASELAGKVVPRASGREYGPVVASPDIIVLVTNQECRAFAIPPSLVLLGNTDTEPYVIAHELGHAIGGLDDEYPESGRECTGQINATPVSDIRWACLLSPLPTAESCPDGSAIGAYPPVLGCDDWGHPCLQCMMLYGTRDFCTVCSHRLDLVFNVRMNHLVFSDVDETCNGIDDNMDGSTDEGCACCVPEPEACGDGRDNDCDGSTDEGCLACGDGGCDADAGETCGSCPADCGACPPACPNGACEPAAGESCSTCPADCGACPPACPNGACEPAAGESCSTCPADCGECSWCGDGICGSTESCSSCPTDCGTCSWCGDGICDAAETCSSCPGDCGACEVCGDSRCLGPETCSSCPTDCCPVCGNGMCDATEFCFTCPADCGVCSSGCGDGLCDGSEYCYECAMDCCPECGYGTCDPIESCSSCPTDCCPVCGNGTCEIAESCTFCPRDCGEC